MEKSDKKNARAIPETKGATRLALNEIENVSGGADTSPPTTPPVDLTAKQKAWLTGN